MFKEFLKSHDKNITENYVEEQRIDEGSMLGVMQVYLKDILKMGLDTELDVRTGAINVIHLI